MKCEICGAKIYTLLIDIFSHNGKDYEIEHPIKEFEKNAVTVDVTRNWVGEDLSEEEQMETILCPICKKFPFKHREVQAYELIRIVCFKEE